MLKLRSISTALSFFLLFLWVSPLWAKPQPLPKNSYLNYSFKVPPGLQARVDFWKNVYTKYTTKQSIVHDMNHMDVIYEVVNLDPKKSYRQNERMLKRVRNKYKKILRRLAKKKDHSSLTPLEKRVKHLVKGRYYSASRNIRTQTGQKDRFRAGLERSGMYMDEIRRIFAHYGLPMELTVLPHVESSFQLNAYSHAGASGIWQFTRGTGRLFMNVGYEVDERLDPILATHGAAKLLKYNFDEVQNWPMAITAYNHGLNGMLRAKKRYGEDIVRVIQNYRSRTFGFASKNFYAEFLAALEIVKNHKKYFPDVRFASPRPMVSVRFKEYIHVNTAKKYFNMTTQEIAEYNPALRQPVLSGNKRIPAGFMFKAPSQKFANLATRYGNIPNKLKHRSQVRSKWYTVRTGDTLSTIARRFRTSVTKLKEVNHIRRADRIYKGQVLQLPGRYRSRSDRTVVAKSHVQKPKSDDKKVTTRTETVFYKVRKRDSLSKVAKRFGTAAKVLQIANGLKNPNDLAIGQVLKVPRTVVVAEAPETKTPVSVVKHEDNKPHATKVVAKNTSGNGNEIQKTASATMKSSPSPKAKPLDPSKKVSVHLASLEKYNASRPAFNPISFVGGSQKKVGLITVDYDETLSHYADWSGLSVHDLRRHNGFSSRSTIHINQKIRVPFSRKKPEQFQNRRQKYHRAIQEDFFSHYRVKEILVKNISKGETLWEICNEMFFIPFWLLNQFNPETNINSLQVGDSIVIPIITPLNTKDA